MANRVLGKATYYAHRIGGVVTLTAAGEFPNFNDKADFDQLPFDIFPPQFGFYFINKSISLPAIKPFSYSEVISFPASAMSITIIDVDGPHVLDIDEIQVLEPTESKPAGSEQGYCVFGLPDRFPISLFNIAKCLSMDKPELSLYQQLFGPATYAQCEKYVKDHQDK